MCLKQLNSNKETLWLYVIEQHCSDTSQYPGIYSVVRTEALHRQTTHMQSQRTCHRDKQGGTDLKLCFQKRPTRFAVQPVIVSPVRVPKFCPAAAQEPPHAFINLVFCLRASTLLRCLRLRPRLPALTQPGCSRLMIPLKWYPVYSGKGKKEVTPPQPPSTPTPPSGSQANRSQSLSPLPTQSLWICFGGLHYQQSWHQVSGSRDW